ncbi:M4 family metallopeptidase [Hymenobacter terricola]|uniref:M4 family metallopeptidase n=1 Tax=Hymenobacter terricola TaxID=2819236 RepID=UPI001B3063DA|nr:M4 family metallopeptidase [Hymenobacter terricola]
MMKTYSATALLLLGGASLTHTAQAQDAARAATPTTVLAEDGSPLLINLAATGRTRALSEASQVLTEQLQLKGDDHLQRTSIETDLQGFTHEKYQQYYKGIKVEHAVYSVHARQGQVETLSGKFERIQGLNTAPTLSAAAALQGALSHVGARKYMWEVPGAGNALPQGELVIVENHRPKAGQAEGAPVLAWKFNIYAQQPISRSYVYVDARSGAVVLEDKIIKHATAATATFATAYSGTRTLATETATGGYHLREYTRGLGIETYNCKKSNSYTAATDFVDADNNWTAAEYNNANYDNVAGDAHFGAQSTYDYWKNVFGRNSYDNAGAKIKSYVHFDDVPGGAGFENAYWDGTEMTYGDGASTFKPLTALDVCGHEIGHAVCEKTANLTYANESGAMNEGLSDIWGASIEQYTCAALGLTKSTWDIGEDIMKAGGALRSMSNPNLYGQPAYYKGQYWAATTTSPSNANDQGGVHTNSGILNYWYYLISTGKTGTNEKGFAYAVTGIGISDAAKITFRMESVYMTAGSSYANARTYSIQAATDLFGATATQTQAVTNAWYAVGIGAAYGGGTTTSPYCTSQGASVAYEYLAQVALGSINRTSGADGGYYDGTVLGTSVAQGSVQTITYKAGFVSSAYTENVKVYIDWNQNGTFTDAGETVVSATTATTTAQTASFTVPATATAGKTRMRVVLSDNAATTSCGSYSYGETEDYSVTVTTGTGTTCGVPTGLTSSGLTGSGATVAWTAVSGASSYNVQYRVSGGSTWTSTTSTTTSKALTGLAASTTYEFQVQTVCSGGNSAFSASGTFTTTAATVAYCASQGTSVAYEYIDLVSLGSTSRTSGADGGYYNGTALSTSVAAGSAQTISFSAGFVGTAYSEYFKVYIDYNHNGVFTDAGELVVSAAASTAATTRTGSFTVPASAKSGATRLRVVMSDNSATTSCGSFSYGETEDYTLNITGGTFALTGSAIGGSATLAVYPNPATDRLHLTLPDNAEPVTVTLLDARGATVTGTRYEGNGQLNLAGLANGLYVVRVSDGTNIFTQRFVKQ